MSGIVKAAGIIIFRRLSATQPEFLLLQASYGTHHWSPPKGHVDPGEDDLTTAVRETQEEANLNREDYKLFENFKVELNYTVNNKPKSVIYWLAELKDPNKTIKLSDEHQDLTWLPIQEACVRSGFDDMKSALEKANQFIVSNL